MSTTELRAAAVRCGAGRSPPGGCVSQSSTWLPPVIETRNGLRADDEQFLRACADALRAFAEVGTRCGDLAVSTWGCAAPAQRRSNRQALSLLVPPAVVRLQQRP